MLFILNTFLSGRFFYEIPLRKCCTNTYSKQ